MKNATPFHVFLGVAAVGLTMAWLVPISAAGHDADKQHTAMVPEKAGQADVHKEHIGHLDAALKSIDAATKAVEAGHKDVALASLTEARTRLAALRQAMLRTDRIVNVRCPIMGTKLAPEKVPAHLTREYKGQKVGFCCAGCPSAWDKLSDEERLQKLRSSVENTQDAPDNPVKRQHEGHGH